MSHAIETVRNSAGQVLDRGEREVRAFLSRLRPRMSLAGGSILVLLTLFLPLGYDACGPKHPGYELAQGKGEWPTFLGVFVSETAGRDFYILVLLLSVLTTLFVFFSFFRPDRWRSPASTHRLFVLTGTLSLFLVSDVLLIVPFAEDRYGSAAFVLGLVSCLSPGLFWPRRVFWGWLSALAISISLLFIAESMKWEDSDAKTGLTLAFVALFTLVPLGMWWRFGIPWRGHRHADWEVVRRGLVAFYLPAVLGNIWFFRIAASERIWGFVPCYFGIHLMTIGYMQLVREDEQRSAGATAAT